MKRIILMIMASVMLVSCGTSGKVSTKTYVMPGAKLASTPTPNAIRAWGMGISDDPMTAQDKAQDAARRQLAKTLESIVTTTADQYCVMLTEGEIARSKQFLNQKTTVFANQKLRLAREIFNKWGRPDANGMHTCYIVLELAAQDYVNGVTNTIDRTQGEANVNIDTKVFEELLFKTINSGK